MPRRGDPPRAATDITKLWAPKEAADPVPWLARHGWSVTVGPMTEVAAGYGRPLAGTLPESMLSTVVITALRPA